MMVPLATSTETIWVLILFLVLSLLPNSRSLEQEAGVVPFNIAEEFFDKLFLLVDGIYLKYNLFVHSYKTTITSEQQRYSGWQEAVRKDIERAFGVLKAHFSTTNHAAHSPFVI
jgi:hypothetical protein